MYSFIFYIIYLVKNTETTKINNFYGFPYSFTASIYIAVYNIRVPVFFFIIQIIPHISS